MKLLSDDGFFELVAGELGGINYIPINKRNFQVKKAALTINFSD